MGPGGEEAAGALAEAGLDVVGIESTLVGGECPYWACVPTKMMLRAADSLAEAHRVNELSGTATVTPDWSPVARRIREEATDDWNDRAAVDRFEGKGGRFVRGTARLTGRQSVSVDGKELNATRALVIATGSRPAIPPIEDLRDLPFWTNREAVEATSVPRSLTIIGGGAVGVEFAQVFSRFGAEVTILEVADRLLAQEEPEASQLLAKVFDRQGIRVTTGAKIDSVSFVDAEFTVQTGGGHSLKSERLLVATGRKPDLRGLGVQAAGLDENKRFLEVDENLRVAEGIWAIGDPTGKGAFTHVAVYQARIATADILGRPHALADYRALPRVTFTDPEVGAVGLTEQQARSAGMAVRTAISDIPSSTRGWIHKVDNDGLIKLVADGDRGILVGATSMGPVGGEVLGALAVAVHAEVPVSVLSQMIYAYPTFHRAIEDAIRQLV